MAFAGFRIPCDNELRSRLSDFAQHELDRAKEINAAMNNQQFQLNVTSRVHSWGTLHVPPRWHQPNNWIDNLDLFCSFPNDRSDIIDKIQRNHVFCFQSSTGSGKSTFAPALAFEGVRRAISSGRSGSSFDFSTGFKCIQLVPSGEQSRQNAQYVRKEYRTEGGLFVGSYSSALNCKGRRKNVCVKGKTNILYATYFFGDHALHQDNVMHVVIVDEVHDLTPAVVSLLGFLKEKLVKKDILRIILLTATLTPTMEARLQDYFRSPSMFYTTHKLLNTSPHPVVVSKAHDDTYSSGAMATVSDRNAWVNEHRNGLPFMRVLRERACRLIIGRLLAYGPNLIPADQLKNGFLVFLPGSNDVVKCKAQFHRMLTAHCPHLLPQIALYHVSGLERNDLKFLTDPTEEDENSEEEDNEDGPRPSNEDLTKKDPNEGKLVIVFATPLLESGVTLRGIYYIVDTGTEKIPAPHNRQGIERLEIVWEDANSREQRKGRVGRTETGHVYQMFSRITDNAISASDHTLKSLQSMYTTSDLVPIVNETRDLLYTPDSSVEEILKIEAGITGFFCNDRFADGYTSTTELPKIDQVGVAYSRCFKGVPLDLCNFLVYCDSYGCLFPGLVLTTAILSRHVGLKRPSKEGPGRDCPNFHLNEWTNYSGCPVDGDLVIYTDILMNLMIIKIPFLRHESLSAPFLPPTCMGWMEGEGTDEVRTIYCSLVAACRALGLIAEDLPIENLTIPAVSGVNKEIVWHDMHHKHYGYWRMDPYTLTKFKVAMHAALGSRVLIKCPSAYNKRQTHTIYMVPDYPSSARPYQVQGERMRHEASDLLAIYYSIFVHSPDDEFLTAFIQQTSAREMMLYGNASGASSDIVDLVNNLLTIHLNVGSLVFKFEDEKLLQAVAQFRKMLSLTPAAHLMNRRIYNINLLTTIRNINPPQHNIYQMGTDEQHILASAHVINDLMFFM